MPHRVKMLFSAFAFFVSALVIFAGTGFAQDRLIAAVPGTDDDRWLEAFASLRPVLAPNQLDIRPAHVFGREHEILDLLGENVIHMAILRATVLALRDARFLAAELPIIAADVAESDQILVHPDIEPALESAAASMDLVILGRYASVSVLGSARQCLQSPADVNGLRIIAYGSARLPLIRAGASVINLPFGEVYLALQAGVADAAVAEVEAAIEQDWTQIWHCVTGATRTPLFHSWRFVVANQSVTENLSESGRDALRRRIADILDREKSKQVELAAHLESLMSEREGVAAVDSAAWRELAQSHYADIIEQATEVDRAVLRAMAEHLRAGQ